MVITTDTMVMSSSQQALIRLLQLVSPTLPTGSFSYSQGLEWAVEAKWVHDADSLERWLSDVMQHSLARVDIPLLHLLYSSCVRMDLDETKRCSDLLLACRESKELRAEETQRGKAMAILLTGLGLIDDEQWKQVISRSQLAGFAYAASAWKITLRDAAIGYIWSWLENQVITGVKIIPLGQTSGQQLLLKLGAGIDNIVTHALQLREDEIGAATTSLALASCFHETQYTRLYRS